MEDEWWVRRMVLTVLLVVAVVATVYAVVEVRSGSAPAEEADLGEAVETETPVVPVASEGPLRLGEVQVAGRHGDPVLRPAHTLEGFDLAMAAGVDYVEAQVAMTQDGQLVLRSDNELTATTDVAERPEFADRRVTKPIDGGQVTGWFTEDFTLAELETLRAVEPDPELRPGAAAYDGQLPLLGLDALLERVVEVSTEQDREIGVVIQPVRAGYFRSEGLPIEPAVAKAIRARQLMNDAERVTVESPDAAVLARIEANMGDNVLTAYIVEAGTAGRLEVDALAALPDTIDALMVEVGAFAAVDDPFELADRVHDAGLALVVYPISYENARLSAGNRSNGDPNARGNLRNQVAGLRLIGTDLILAESPDEVIELVADLAAEDAASPTPSSDTPSD